MSKKMYVLVRKDLPGSQPAVQAGHALAEYLLEYPDCEWTNGTLVYLGVEDESQLEDFYEDMNHDHYDFAYFYEPDMDDEMTAIASFDKDGYLEKLFKDLQLL